MMACMIDSILTRFCISITGDTDEAAAVLTEIIGTMQ